MKNFHLFAKLCKITPNFYLILSNEVTVGANRKFFTLSLNGLKAIPANKSNYGGKQMVVAIPTSVGNNYECL